YLDAITTNCRDIDTDGDGVVDRYDLDIDNDGIPNAVEANNGSLPANMEESGMYGAAYASVNDADGDGLVDNIDTDEGGTPLVMTDTDSDGLADYRDRDSDADGISDEIESQATDTNANGYFDSYADTDSDGLADYRDIDADGDGITDLVEAQSTVGTAAASGNDTNNDGMDDSFDSTNGGTEILPVDTDNDGDADYVDTDSDNDSIDDSIEGHDANSDGTADRAASNSDTDGDGLDNAYDTDNGGTAAPLQISVAGTEPDFRNNDDDNDGIPSLDESADSNPADGTPDYLQATSDTCGEGLVEQSFSGNMQAGIFGFRVASFLNALNEPDFDGTTATVAQLYTSGYILYDFEEFIPAGETITLYLVTQDGDDLTIGGSTDQINYTNFVNYVDNTGAGYTLRTYDYTVGGEGLRYIYFLNNNETGTIYIDAATYDFTRCLDDQDNDGVADEVDLDDDNDGIPDLTEVGYAGDPSGDDDNDAIPNYRDTDYSGFTDSNFDEVDDNADFDLDGIPNHLDLDSDNDGMSDAREANGGNLPANMLSVGRYSATYLSSNDSDGDGLANDVEATALSDPDFDSDGQPDRLDLDSDNDGITDAAEMGGADTDGDGFIDEWSDNNGDGQSESGLVTNPTNSDSSGNADYRQADSDGDGIDDVIEGHDNNEDGYGDWDADNNNTLSVAEGNADADGDGLLDAFDPDATGFTPQLVDSDNDGLYNYQDTDDDNDGVLTASEDGNSNGDLTDDFTSGQAGSHSGTPDYLYNGLTILPVELLDFYGMHEEGRIILDWITASEKENSHFEVERANEDLTFERIGTVEGVGDTDERIDYRFTDTEPNGGYNYYRLKQVDYNGDYTYSETIRVNAPIEEAGHSVEVYPNPMSAESHTLYATIDGLTSSVAVEVYFRDSFGRIVSQTVVTAHASQIRIEADDLPKDNGVYILTLDYNGTRHHERIIIER
ncbi:MAG: T9SS type A sorting domain-containing protein, partial [Cyclobacteriaceae bacterium]